MTHGTLPVGWRCFVTTAGVTYRKSFRQTVEFKRAGSKNLFFGSLDVIIMENPFTGKWFYR